MKISSIGELGFHYHSTHGIPKEFFKEAIKQIDKWSSTSQ